ncbi:MAG: acyl-ACP--UDP-N-acetylglucosamine O-acyltransferase [Planctomycetes bacterium]|nr:acyl-ACP--UDP-N-acetylglucosamine O-acyltransferase [Planctomycetota bacterium]
MRRIHPTAVVDPAAELGEDVVVGPYCVIEGPVKVGAHTVLRAHVTLMGRTTLGQGNVLYPGAVLGAPPQDLKFADETTYLVVGDRNQIREHVTFHPGTAKGGGTTRVGDDGLYMVGCHVAHDGHVGNHVIMANHVLLAGHVTVGDRAILNGACAAHHFASIGRLAYVGGLSRINRDVPPFCIAEGHPMRIRGANVVGMRRAGFSPDAVERVRDAVFRVFVRHDEPARVAMERLEREHPGDPLLAELIAFTRAGDQGRNGRANDRRVPVKPSAAPAAPAPAAGAPAAGAPRPA